jgi:hypothetical protein
MVLLSLFGYFKTGLTLNTTEFNPPSLLKLLFAKVSRPLGLKMQTVCSSETSVSIYNSTPTPTPTPIYNYLFFFGAMFGFHCILVFYNPNLMYLINVEWLCYIDSGLSKVRVHPFFSENLSSGVTLFLDNLNRMHTCVSKFIKWSLYVFLC